MPLQELADVRVDLLHGFVQARFFLSGRRRAAAAPAPRLRLRAALPLPRRLELGEDHVRQQRAPRRGRGVGSGRHERIEGRLVRRGELNEVVIVRHVLRVAQLVVGDLPVAVGVRVVLLHAVRALDC